MIRATVRRLTELQYTDELTGALQLYVYQPDSSSRTGYETRTWFTRQIRYPDEQITIGEAKRCVEAAMARGQEVRITNGGDNLVFHAKDGKVLWPKAGAEGFWKRVEATL
jgi:hypothetical protein